VIDPNVRNAHNRASRSRRLTVPRNVVRSLIVCCLGGALALPAIPAGAAPRCFGKAATIVGTGRKDRLKGTNGNDVIVGRGGHDFITGGGGKDRICGNGGDDVLLGGSGKDLLDGAAGADFLSGGPSRDKLLAGPGAFNVLRGNQGNDTLRGGPGFDILLGEAGNDRLDGGGGVFDRASFFFSSAPVTSDLNSGQATGEGTDTMVGVEDLEGSQLGDSLTGNAEANFFFPLGGDDVLNGGDGFDLVSFDSSATPVTVDLTAGTATGEGNDTLGGIEDVAGSAHGDTITGDANPNVLLGLEGNDTILAMEADDFLDGGTETDTLDGGPHVMGDRCVNGEVLNECELTTARERSKVTSRSPARVRAALRSTAARLA
jgi:Ca2+-binding RTX toxin-like protein